MKKRKFDLRTLIILALLAAIGALFKAFLSVDFFLGPLKIVDLSLVALPVMLAGIFFGPLAGGLVGFVAETAGYFMTPTGAYNPVFSIVMALLGVIAGLFYLRSKRTTIWKTIGMVVSTQLLCTAVLNTFFINWFYGIPLIALLPGRGIGVAIMTPLLIVLLTILIERLKPVAARRRG